MAVNGILDAFVTSFATPTDLRTQNGWMVLFTGICGAASWLAMSVYGLGARGLVLANILNMSLRIVWAVRFVRRFDPFDRRRNRRFRNLDLVPFLLVFIGFLDTVSVSHAYDRNCSI